MNHNVIHDLVDFVKAQFVAVTLFALIVLAGLLYLHVMHDRGDTVGAIIWVQDMIEKLVAAFLLSLNAPGIVRTVMGRKSDNGDPPEPTKP